MSRRGELLSLGSQQLQEALRLSEGSDIGEFELFIQLELGRLFEDGGAWKRAERFYKAVVETPDDARYRSRLFDDAKARDEAERRGMNARIHLAEAGVSRLYVILFGLASVVAMLLLLGSGAALTQRRRFVRLRSRYAVLRNGKAEEDVLFDRRRRYAYRVMMRPAEVARAIGDPEVSALLEAGLEHQAQLFTCICALERVIDQRLIPQKNMGRYLRRHFKKRNWDWPESVEGWKEHFGEHPL